MIIWGKEVKVFFLNPNPSLPTYPHIGSGSCLSLIIVSPSLLKEYFKKDYVHHTCFLN